MDAPYNLEVEGYPSGQRMQVRFNNIFSINGKPYADGDLSLDDIREAITVLDTRQVSLEELVQNVLLQLLKGED